MSTLADVISDVAAAVLALPGGTKVRLASDYSEALPVSVGQIGVQIRGSLLSRTVVDSALDLEAARIEVFMIHRLGTAESERTYYTGQMVSDQSAMLVDTFWTDLPSVQFLSPDGLPGVSEQPELRGPLFIYSVISDVVLTA